MDLGERRVGIATSDDLGLFAFPDQILDRRRVTLEAVALRAEELAVCGIVVGLPTTMSGEDGHQARIVREEVAELAMYTDLPIMYWDERLTSSIADRALAKRIPSPRKRREQLDAIAAAVMLQDYLDAHPVGLPGVDRPEAPPL